MSDRSNAGARNKVVKRVAAPYAVQFHIGRQAFQRSFTTMTAIAALLCLAGPALAGPVGGTVVDGAAAISQAGTATNIHQSTNKAIINWQGFSVGANESVNFYQPGASSVTLNRVIGNESSVINGAINANGQVFIVNSAGVLFGKGSQVNVGGLVASTHDISNKDFMAGNYTFSGTSNAAVVNQGRIRAHGGGYVALLGKTVSNDGVISARLGTVAMSAGEKLTLNFEGNSLLDVTIDKGALNALVENKRAIIADGGRVILTAKAADQVLAAQVNNTGIVQARTIAALRGGSVATGRKGRRTTPKTNPAPETIPADVPMAQGNIKIYAYGGTATIAGKLDASALKGGDGGFIETSGDKVTIADSASILTASAYGQAGKWLIDPVGFTIGVGGDVTGAFVSNYLATQGDYEVVTTNGDIVINDTISWSKNTLTLSASENILVNNVLTATGAANFAATWGNGTNASGTYQGNPFGLYTSFGVVGATNSVGNSITQQGTFGGRIDVSGSGTVHLQGESYTVIQGLAGLLEAAKNPDRNYVLGADVTDITATDLAASIGSAASPFSGKFEGFGHVVSNLYTTEGVGGLFGEIGAAAIVRNIGIADGAVETAKAAGWNTGMLANVNRGLIVNSFAGGTLGTWSVGGSTGTWKGDVGSSGGLVGMNAGHIGASYSYGLVYGNLSIGGLVGTNEIGGTIVNSFSNSAIRDTLFEWGGGLVAVNAGEIANSYANTYLQAQYEGSLGGFVGLNTGTGHITNSYAFGTVYGITRTAAKGGIAGFASRNDGYIANAYSTGSVGYSGSSGYSGQKQAGFVYNNTGIIENAYTTSAVLSRTNSYENARRAFSAINTGTIRNVYWDASLVGSTVVDGTGTLNGSNATSLNAAEAKIFASYAGFDSAIWGSSANGHLILKTLPVSIGAVSAGEYGIGALLARNLSVRGLQWGDTLDQMLAYSPAASLLSASGYLNAASYRLEDVFTLNGGASYTNIGGLVIISPKTLTLAQSGIVSDKTYDGTTNGSIAVSAANGGLMGFVGSETLVVDYSNAEFADRNAGTSKTVTVTVGLSNGSNGGNASNYRILDGAMLTKANITPKTITASYTVADKTYDGTVNAPVSVDFLTGVIGLDEVAAFGNGTFADANAGMGKAVAILGTLSGADAGNYVLSTAPTGTASINARPLELLATKAYDGSNVVGPEDITVANLIAGDTLVLGSVATSAGSGIGTHGLDLSQMTLGGTTNYTLSGATGKVVIYAAPLPVNPNVVAGDIASISTDFVAKTMTVTQTSDKAIINWQSFDVGAGYTVAFDQQKGVASVTLNRVVGSESSVIAGTVTAPGRVFIVNSAGILFTGASQVNVGALVASTLDISSSDFIGGAYLFDGHATGSIEALGSITTAGEGGYVALLGNGVSNQGAITAKGGMIALLGGSGITLDVDGTSGALVDASVSSGDKAVVVSGALDISSISNSQGTILTQGLLQLDDSVQVSASGRSNWIMRTHGDFAIAADGVLRGASLTNLLSKLNVTAQSVMGDVNVNDAVAWSKNTLTLNSSKNVNINNVLTVSGNGGFTATYGTSYFVTHEGIEMPGTFYVMVREPDVSVYGVNFSFAKRSDGTDADSFAGKINFQSTGAVKMGVTGGALKTYTVVRTASDLAGIENNLAGNYILGGDIDLTGYVDPNTMEQGWTPIGATWAAWGMPAAFTGSLNGFGHIVSNLTSTKGGLFLTSEIVTPQISAGMFNTTKTFGDTPKISNVGLTNISIVSSAADIGGLANVFGGVASNNFVTGNIKATYAAPATGESVGGLFGRALGYVVNNYSRVNVTATNYRSVGGFAGRATSIYIGDSYATGNVVGKLSAYTGGFAGEIVGVVASSHAYGNVEGDNLVGGFVGYVQPITGNVLNSSASGSVTLTNPDPRAGYAGGFAGGNWGGIVTSSSSGRVSSTTGSTDRLGGFAGFTAAELHAFSLLNVFNADTAGINRDGAGNVVPDMSGMGMVGTPILDAFNAIHGTHFTPAQFHGGAIGLNSANFGAMQQIQQTNSSGASQAYQNYLTTGSLSGAGPGSGSGTTGDMTIGMASAGQLGSTIAAGADVASSAATPATAASIKAMQQTAKLDEIADDLKQTEQKVRDDDERRKRERKAAAARANRGNAGGSGSGYGATIRSIDVDGQRFNLEGGGSGGVQ